MTDAAARLPRRFARLTALNILANVAVPLAGLVDVAMLGHLSDLSFLAGVALATILFDYLYWTFGFLRMGTTGVTAQALGRGDDAEVHLTLYRALAFAAGTGAAILLLQVPLGELGFLLLSGGPAVEAAGREYFAARIWAAPAALANFAFLGWYLGREESGRALVMTVVGGFANIGFNYLFIVRLGLAARGAGLGTMTSQYLMLAVAAGMFLARPRPPFPGWPAVADRQRLVEPRAAPAVLHAHGREMRGEAIVGHAHAVATGECQLESPAQCKTVNGAPPTLPQEHLIDIGFQYLAFGIVQLQQHRHHRFLQVAGVALELHQARHQRLVGNRVEVFGALAQQDWPTSVYCAGVLSHYYGREAGLELSQLLLHPIDRLVQKLDVAVHVQCLLRLPANPIQPPAMVAVLVDEGRVLGCGHGAVSLVSCGRPNVPGTSGYGYGRPCRRR